MDGSEVAENAIARWHDVVNSGDVGGAGRVVSDPIVVNGPKGAGPITSEEFGKWITRSGIALRPVSYHPISARMLVVEQDATWPQTPQPSRVATVFRTTGDLVSAALRFPTLRAALDFAYLYRELAATENP